MRNKYHFFWGGPLSQWFSSPFVLDFNEFTHAEQFMMFAKACVFGDKDKVKAILNSNTPKEQKALGRLIQGYEDSTWDKCKFSIVVAGNLAKFSQSKDLKEFLLGTKDMVLVEASPYDCIWGIGLRETDPKRFDESNWRGQNLLGKALMKVRERLKESDTEYTLSGDMDLDLNLPLWVSPNQLPVDHVNYDVGDEPTLAFPLHTNLTK